MNTFIGYWFTHHCLMFLMYVQAALCCVRIIRKVPELVEDYVRGACSLLSDRVRKQMHCTVIYQ